MLPEIDMRLVIIRTLTLPSPTVTPVVPVIPPVETHTIPVETHTIPVETHYPPVETHTPVIPSPVYPAPNVTIPVGPTAPVSPPVTTSVTPFDGAGNHLVATSGAVFAAVVAVAAYML